MNRLPKVLQNEIWEYVRGDRAFFKSQFQIVMTELLFKLPEIHRMHAQMLQDQIWFTGTNSVWSGHRSSIGRWAVGVAKNCRFRFRQVPWQVNVHDSSAIPKRWSMGYFRFEDARAEFHRQVVIAATKTTTLLRSQKL
jgi:hypothetical protein